MKIEEKIVSLPKIICEMKDFIILFAAVLLFAACEKKSENEPVPEPLRRTVIVYMAGENDLDSRGFLNSDMNEMIEGSKAIPTNCRLVAFVDKSSSRQKPFIAEIKNGSCDTVKVYQDDFYASDPARFTEVISTIVSKYTATEYGLILWGHATGWIITRDSVAQSRPSKAYGADTGSNLSYSLGERWMNITQMARALEQLPHFRFIFADCCCMMCAEVAYELRHATDYLIGSPAEIPGGGAPYDTWMKDLFLSTDDFYRNLMNDYYDKFLSEYQTSVYTLDPSTKYLKGHSVPLSVVDMHYMEQLADATRELLQHPDSFQTDSVPYYFAQDYPIMYDMGALLERISTKEAYRQWQTVLDKAVPFRLFSAKWMTIYNRLLIDLKNDGFKFSEDNYSGLSMFVPQSPYNFSTYFRYNETIPSMQWYKAVGWSRFLP